MPSAFCNTAATLQASQSNLDALAARSAAKVLLVSVKGLIREGEAEVRVIDHAAQAEQPVSMQLYIAFQKKIQPWSRSSNFKKDK